MDWKTKPQPRVGAPRAVEPGARSAVTPIFSSPHPLSLANALADVARLLISIKDTATTLGLGRTKIYELVAAGELELVKIGRKSLITAASIEALVARLTSGREAASGAAQKPAVSAPR